MVTTNRADVNAIKGGQETIVKYPVSSVAGSTVHCMADVLMHDASVMLVLLASTAFMVGVSSLLVMGVQARGAGEGKSYFLGRSQQPKMKKNIFFHLLNEETEFILSSTIKCPKSGIFINNNWLGTWDESGKVILQVSCQKKLLAKMAQPAP